MGDPIEMIVPQGVTIYTVNNAARTSDRDDGYVIIDSFTFPFYWFDVNYGNPTVNTNNSKTIYFTTNSILSFGPLAFGEYTNFTSINFNGININTKDRYYNNGYQYNPISSNGYNIKKIKVNLSNTSSSGLDNFEIEIRFIRNEAFKTQYIEIKILKLTDSTSYLWNLKNGDTYKNTFTSPYWANPTVGRIYVLRSDENGNDWELLEPTTNLDVLINYSPPQTQPEIIIQSSQDISNIQPTNIERPVNLVRPIYTPKSIKTTYP
jgi:hypothetical protein